MTDTKTGRPPKYTEAQVLKGIELVEQSGESPSGDAVKKVMCGQLGVSTGINAQSLREEIKRLLDERERERLERLVAALPASSAPAAKDIGTRVGRMVLEHMAGEYEGLRTLTGKKILEMKDDLGTQRAQIRGLLVQADAKEVELAHLEGEKRDLERRLAAATAEIVGLKDLLLHLEKQGDYGAEMLRLVKETLAQHPPAA